MDNLLDGAQVAAEIRAEVAREVGAAIATGARRPGLTAVLVGDDPASKLYVGMKAKACEEVGMVGRTLILPGSTSATELAAEIDRLNADDAVDGILIQLPLPKGIHEHEKDLLARVDPAKDVDGFHPVNVGRLWMDEPSLTPATPTGILELLRRRGIEISGKRAVVVGRSVIVGKPMAALLLRNHATVTLCHSRTKDLAAVCREADILVAATGKAELIGPEHVRPGAVVIDVGTNRVTDRAVVERLFPGNAEKMASFEKRGSLLVGDVDFTRVQPIAGGITPVPGGVGPLTVALLLVNTWKASRLRQGLVAE